MFFVRIVRENHDLNSEWKKIVIYILPRIVQPYLLQRSGPRLPGLATHLPLLRVYVPLKAVHTWEELQPACLKKYHPQGYPSRQYRQNTGFDIKAEQQGSVVQFKASLCQWAIRQVECIICRRSSWHRELDHLVTIIWMRDSSQNLHWV